MKLINLGRMASLLALSVFATATPRVNADTVGKSDTPHCFGVSAYGSEAKDYNNFVWAYGDTQFNEGYACVSHNGVWAYGPMISQQYVSATEVFATYYDSATGMNFTLDLHTDGAAPTAKMAEANASVTETLIPVAPDAIYVQ